MTKKVIAIISVLKPVDDTRNYEKIAKTISNTNKYDTNIIGFSAKIIPANTNITFHPIFNFKRTSITRLGASLLIWKKLLKLKPELIIVTAAELLIVSVLHHILFGTKIIYDIQENYYRNISYTDSYPPIIRYPIAFVIRGIEIIASLFVDKIILAERVYSEQMKYLSAKAIIIENKALIPDYIKNEKQSKTEHMTFVYSGTIAEHYGIFDAIEFIKQLKSSIDHVQLVIIGYTAQKHVYHKLHKLSKGFGYIKIIGGDSLVPHNQILKEIKRTDFCLLPYQKNKSTEGCIPTKLFECLAMEKPVIIPSSPTWDAMIKENNAGILFDFKNIVPSLLQKLNKKYYGNHLSSQFEWEQISDKLLKTIRTVI